ncbi:ribonuclease H-like domain-containing protein [Tanacetum coccineum]
MVPRAVLMKSGLVSLNIARQVNTAHPKIIMNSARPMINLSKSVHSTVKWPIHKNTTLKNNNFNHRVNTVKDTNVNIVRPKAVVNDARPNAVVNVVKGNNINAVKASAWNMFYLTDYEEIDGGYVAFGGNPKGGKITRKSTIKTATKDETSGILKSFITRVENLIDQRVKVIRCDNGTEFKNKEMNQFCERKCIKREFSVARTPQQNRVAERKNRTLIKAARTMLADSKLLITFWAEAVNTACYVQNRVLVTKPHNKTPYELFLGRKSALGFMRPFGCPITILNTIDHLGKFDGKADEGFFVWYSINSKAFRVLNSKTRIVEKNLHVQFSENTPNIVKLEWSQYGKDYILLPLWTADPPFSQISKSSPDAGFKPSGDDEKKATEEPGKEGGDPSKEDERDDQEKDAYVNSTNNVNTASINEVNVVDDDEDIGVEADMNNLDAFMSISHIPTTRVHKDHLVEQIIKDLNSVPQTRRMTKNLEEHGFEDPDFPDRVYKVEKAFYRLHQASRAWFETLSTSLLDNGFQRGKINKTFFIKRDKGDILLVQVYVDDIIFGSTKKSLCIEFEKMVHKKFQMSSMCELTFFLGLFTNVKTASTPMETQKLLLKDENVEECVPVQDTKSTQSDYAGAILDRKSTTGGCQFLRSRLISWQCKKQTVVANP